MALGTGVHNLSLVVRATNRTRRAMQQVGRDLTLLDRTRAAVSKGFGQMGSIGAAAIRTLAIAVGLGVAGSILAFSRFDDAMTESLAIAGEVAPEMRKLMSDTAREIAKVTTFSAKQAAEGYYFLLSAGLDVAQSLEALPVTAAFAQAGLIDLALATELLTDAQSALGRDMEDPMEHMREMTKLSDILIQATKSANATTEQFAESLTNRAASTMRTYNIEVEEGVAVLAAWADQGLKGRTAGEAFSNVVRDLLKAQTQNTQAWKDNGLAVLDANNNMRSMADIIGDLEAAFDGLSDGQKKQMLQDLGFQERTQQRILQIMGSSDAIREYTALFREAGGVTQEVAEKQLQSATAQLKLLSSAIVDVFIGAGEQFNDIFIDMLKWLRQFANDVGPKAASAAATLAEWFNELRDIMSWLPTHLRAVSEGGAGFAKTLEEMEDPAKTVIELLERLAQLWGKIPDWGKRAAKEWAQFIPLIFLAAGAFRIIFTVLRVIGGPAAILAAAISLIIVTIKTLYEESEEFRNLIAEVVAFFQNTVAPILKEVWEQVQVKFSEFVNWVATVGVPWLVEAWDLIQEAAQSFALWFESELLPKVLELWEQIKDTFSAAWEFISELWETVTTLISEIWDEWGGDILATLADVVGILIDVLTGAFKIVEGIFQVFSAILTGDWNKLWEGLKNILIGVWNIIWGFLSRVFRDIWNDFVTWLSDIWDEWVSTWNSFVTGAEEGWSQLVSWFEGAWAWFSENWMLGWETIKEFVTNIFTGLADSLIPPFNAVLALIERVVNLGIGGINKVINVANKLPGIEMKELGKIEIPRLAQGGKIMARGLAIVGEAGPELLKLPRGAVVEPLARYPGAGPSGGGETIIFQGTPQQMLSDWRRESKLRMAGL